MARYNAQVGDTVFNQQVDGNTVLMDKLHEEIKRKGKVATVQLLDNAYHGKSRFVPIGSTALPHLARLQFGDDTYSIIADHPYAAVAQPAVDLPNEFDAQVTSDSTE